MHHTNLDIARYRLKKSAKRHKASRVVRKDKRAAFPVDRRPYGMNMITFRHTEIELYEAFLEYSEERRREIEDEHALNYRNNG